MSDKYSRYEDGTVGITEDWTKEEFESAKRELADSLMENGATLKESIQLMSGLTSPYEFLAAQKVINIMYPKKLESIQDPPRSVVRQGGGGGGSWTFSSVREGIDELYRLEKAGNVEAKHKLDQLRRKVEQALRANPNLSFSISACPNCGAGIESNSEICPACGFDLVNEFTSKGGELVF